MLASKVKLTIFWDASGVLYVEFLTKRLTANSNRYCATLRSLKIRSWRSSSVKFIPEAALSSTSSIKFSDIDKPEVFAASWKDEYLVMIVKKSLDSKGKKVRRETRWNFRQIEDVLLLSTLLHTCLKDTLLTTFPEQRRKRIQHNIVLLTAQRDSKGKKANRGRLSAEHPSSHLSERHFVDYIPRTKKKTNSTQQCVTYCSKRDSKGKKVRRETRWNFRQIEDVLLLSTLLHTCLKDTLLTTFPQTTKKENKFNTTVCYLLLKRDSKGKKVRRETRWNFRQIEDVLLLSTLLHTCLKDTLLTTFPEQRRKRIQHNSVLPAQKDSKGKKANRGRPSAEHPSSHLSERHFVDYIPRTKKKTNSTQQCVTYCSKRDSKGKKANRGRPSAEHPSSHLSERHFVDYIPRTKKKMNSTQQCVTYCSKRDSKGKKANRGRPSAEHPSSHLSERHFVDYIPRTKKKTNSTQQCVTYCSKRDSKGKKANRGRPSAEHPSSHLSERHFVDYIPRTKKKTNSTQQCVTYCSKRDSKGKKVRRETRWNFRQIEDVLLLSTLLHTCLKDTLLTTFPEQRRKRIQHNSVLLTAQKRDSKGKKANRGRPSAEHPSSHLSERHFVDYIPRTKKKTNSTQQCVTYCSKRDSKGKKVRRETRWNFRQIEGRPSAEHPSSHLSERHFVDYIPEQRRKRIQHNSVLLTAQKETVKGRRRSLYAILRQKGKSSSFVPQRNSEELRITLQRFFQRQKVRFIVSLGGEKELIEGEERMCVDQFTSDFTNEK
ncbi:hypothetical protein TNCV_2206031 [Trichonephila clavipes]|nr:hypothetical protein TNCV_2206031 [Trichonephila clavipes]